MVSDSKVTMEGEAGSRIYQAQKIVEKNGDFIGCAGSNEYIEKFMKWYGSKRKKPTLPKDADFEALILKKDGRLLLYDETLTCDSITDPYYAIGSGGAAAHGALHAGATLEQAVEIACRIDPYSGLPIQILARGDN